MFGHSSRPRHAVIDQDGLALDDTRPLRGLRAALQIALHNGGDGSEAPVSHLLHDGSPTRVLPVHGARTIVMRVPSAPQPPSLAARFPRSFFDDPEFVSRLSQFQVGVHHAAYAMRSEFNTRMGALVRRAREVSASWRYANAGAAGHDLAAAYAEGGTEQVLKLTPAVLAAMDARAKAGTEVAA